MINHLHPRDEGMIYTCKPTNVLHHISRLKDKSHDHLRWRKEHGENLRFPYKSYGESRDTKYNKGNIHKPTGSSMLNGELRNKKRMFILLLLLPDCT